MSDTRHRWMLLLFRGGVAAAMGVVAWLWPLATIAVVAVMFGGFALLDGGFALAMVFSVRSPLRWVNTLLIESLISVAAGMITLLVPNLSPIALEVIVGGWAIATGVLEMVTAYRVGRARDGRVLLALAGLISIATGLAFMFHGGDRALLVLIAVFAFAFGISMAFLGLRLRRLRTLAVR